MDPQAKEHPPAGAGIVSSSTPQLSPSLADTLAAVQRIHETLHAEGTARIATYIKLGTRTDKEPSLQGKLFE